MENIKHLRCGETVWFGCVPLAGRVLHVLGPYVAVRWSDQPRPSVYDSATAVKYLHTHKRAEQVCSCEESTFLRRALTEIQVLATSPMVLDLAQVLALVAAKGFAALGARGSCPEALHYRHALRACVGVATSPGVYSPYLIDDLAQCNNLAGQGLNLESLTGDPGVYAEIAEVIKRTK